MNFVIVGLTILLTATVEAQRRIPARTGGLPANRPAPHHAEDGDAPHPPHGDHIDSGNKDNPARGTDDSHEGPHFTGASRPRELPRGDQAPSVPGRQSQGDEVNPPGNDRLIEDHHGRDPRFSGRDGDVPGHEMDEQGRSSPGGDRPTGEHHEGNPRFPGRVADRPERETGGQRPRPTSPEDSEPREPYVPRQPSAPSGKPDDSAEILPETRPNRRQPPRAPERPQSSPRESGALNPSPSRQEPQRPGLPDRERSNPFDRNPSGVGTPSENQRGRGPDTADRPQSDTGEREPPDEGTQPQRPNSRPRPRDGPPNRGERPPISAPQKPPESIDRIPSRPQDAEPPDRPKLPEPARPDRPIDDSYGRPESEQKRSPQMPERGLNTRNTVCETVCTCQQKAAYCRDAGLRSIPTPFPQGLESITIEDNSLGKIASNDFSETQFASVTQLELNKNRIKRIEAKAFTGLNSVREISIQSNDITTIANDAFFGLQNLQTLSLSSNKLKELNLNAFGSSANLRSIVVENNRLETLPSEFFEKLPTLTTLSLGGNPWECNCDLLGLFVWLQSTNNQLQGSIAECSTPSKWEGRRLDAFTTKDMQQICIEDDDDEEEESVKEKIEESCEDHESDNIVNICYISEPLFVQPGKRVCVHCAATTDDEEIEYLYEVEYEYYGGTGNELEISWILPSHISNENSTSPDNGTFCIENAQAEDSGEYKCVATFGNFSDEKSVRIAVNDLANKVAVGIGIFIGSSVFFTGAFIAKWWAGELRAIKR